MIRYNYRDVIRWNVELSPRKPYISRYFYTYLLGRMDMADNMRSIV